MRTIVVYLVIAVLCCSVPMAAQQKLAQTGMKFLNVGTDPRAVALGEAVTSESGSSAALFYNPAGMAEMTSTTHAMVGQTQWIADIKQYYGSAAVSLGDIGVFGVTLQTVDYGKIIETIRDANPSGYLELGTFKPSALMAGFGYARALSEKFSVGGNIKYVRQALGQATVRVGQTKAANTTNVWAVDFGVLYHTGFKSLNFGMAVRNFSREARFQEEGFQLPLTFKVGVSMDLVDLTGLNHDMHAFKVSVDAGHPRDFPEQVMVGAEYLFMKTLALRVGYVSPADEHHLSYGVGLQQKLVGVGLGVDYAYTPFGIFGDVHRFSFQFSF